MAEEKKDPRIISILRTDVPKRSLDECLVAAEGPCIVIYESGREGVISCDVATNDFGLAKQLVWAHLRRTGKTDGGFWRFFVFDESAQMLERTLTTVLFS